jgi:hypothetical protein
VKRTIIAAVLAVMMGAAAAYWVAHLCGNCRPASGEGSSFTVN